MAFRTLTLTLSDVRSALDEPTTQAWTDAEITRWINEGARDVTRRSKCLQTTGTINLVNTTQDYSLPTNCIQAHKAEVTSGSFIIPLEYRSQDEMDAFWHSNKSLPGVPMFWTAWGFGNSETITFFPVPNASMTAKVWYARLSTDAASGGDPIEVPEGWFDMVVDYAVAQAFRKDGDPRWTDAITMYENKIMALTRVMPVSDQPAAQQWQRVDPYATQMQPSMVPIQQQPGGPQSPLQSYLTPQSRR